MPVNQALMATGDWSVKLRPDTPWRVTDLVDPETYGFSMVAVTPVRLDPATFQTSTARIWDSAIYSGVLRFQESRLTIGGPGGAWWMGDESGSGDWEYAGWTGIGVAFGLTISAIATDYLGALGVAHPYRGWGPAATVPAGNRTLTIPSGTLRERAEFVCKQWDTAEWVCYPDMVVYFGTPAGLYGADPVAVVGRVSTGSEAGVRGIAADIVPRKHLEQYATAVGVESGGAATYATLTTPYRDVNGVLARVTRRVTSTNTSAGDLASYAAQELGWVDTYAWSVDVTTDAYAIADSVPCGSEIWLTDEEQGVTGLAADRRTWAGQQITPVRARVVGSQWPIQSGMGVYAMATITGSAYTVLDLTDWVEFEPAGARLTVGLPDLDLATVMTRRQLTL